MTRYGKRKDLKEADEALQRHKDMRKRLGLRHDRERNSTETIPGRKPEGDKTPDEREGDRSAVTSQTATKEIPASKRVRMATTGSIASSSAMVRNVDEATSLLSHIRKSA